jgi:hypothetical protein
MDKSNKNNKLQIRNSTAEFLTFAYQSKGDGVEVRVQDGTIWLSQKNMGLLFETTTENEFEKYRPIQDRLFESDFDRAMKMLGNNNELNTEIQ